MIVVLRTSDNWTIRILHSYVKYFKETVEDMNIENMINKCIEINTIQTFYGLIKLTLCFGTSLEKLL